MRGYGQFCPVSQATEVLGERWTLLVVRELLAGSTRFNELHRGVPQMSTSLLSQRLRTLVGVGVVERQPREDGSGHEYVLTRAGEELRPIVEQLGRWGQRWVRHGVDAQQADVGLLMWDLRRNVMKERLPDHRVVIHFRYPEAPGDRTRFWLVLQRPDVELCLKDPGHQVDVRVTATPEAMIGVWMGDITWVHAMRQGGVKMDGPTELVRALPSWLGLSPFADVVRADADRTGAG